MASEKIYTKDEMLESVKFAERFKSLLTTLKEAPGATPAMKREFSLAHTHFEDAIIRFDRGFAIYEELLAKEGEPNV